MFQGYKTWVGLVLATLGAVGVFEKSGIEQEQASQIIDGFVQLAGLLIAAYGNWDAHRRLTQNQ